MKVYQIYGEGNRQTAGGIAVARRMGQNLSDDPTARARADSLRRFAKARADGLTAAAARKPAPGDATGAVFSVIAAVSFCHFIKAAPCGIKCPYECRGFLHYTSPGGCRDA